MKTLLQSFTGSLLAILLLVGIAAGYGACAANRETAIENHSWLVVELQDSLLEYDPPGGIMARVTGAETETLQRILDNMKKAAVDERIEGVILKFASSSAMGGGKSQELRGAIREVRDAGKKVLVWAESFDEYDYVVMAAADEILAPPTAYIGFNGFSGTTMHVKNMLETLGIRPNIHQIKDYKSAAELVTRVDMSDPARENSEWMMDELWDQYAGALEADRGLGADRIAALMERAIFTGDEALEAGLVDRLLYWDELVEELEQEDDDTLRTVSMQRYASETMEDLGLGGDRTIAVIHAQGTIMGRDSGVNPLFGVTMGHETIRAELARARRDDDVDAVILRVDSPGGDALGSDLMGREVEVTAGVKPVVVSMVDVAASGGYHISYRASRIVANPMTVTGSIGSISGKFNLAPLHAKLGITHDFVTRGPSALMDSSYTDYTEAERARFEDDHWKGFNHWLRDVSEHRGMDFEKAETLAHGRVWTGRQAVSHGLADELGDLDHAVEVARKLAGIPEDEAVTLVHYPEKKSLLQTLTGGGDDVAVGARWLVHRELRRELNQTLELLRHELATAELGITSE